MFSLVYCRHGPCRPFNLPATHAAVQKDCHPRRPDGLSAIVSCPCAVNRIDMSVRQALSKQVAFSSAKAKSMSTWSFSSGKCWNVTEHA